MARRYEFYVRVARTIWRLNIEYFRFYCVVLSSQVTFTNTAGLYEKRREKKAGIVTSLNDTTLAKVTYGKYATRVPDEVAYGIYEWFSSH